MTLSMRIFSKPNCLRRSSDEIRFSKTAICSRIRLRAASQPCVFWLLFVFGIMVMAVFELVVELVGDRPPLDGGGVGGLDDGCWEHFALCS